MAFLGLVTDIPRERDELLFIFKQVAVYVVVFSIFFGGSAIYNERKSRRILAVLSKGIARQQYLSGLIIGITIACGIYCFDSGIYRQLDPGTGRLPHADHMVLHGVSALRLHAGGNHRINVFHVPESILCRGSDRHRLECRRSR